MRHTRLEHRFVQYIPENLEEGVLYVSIEYATAIHSCCCGCGNQVVTPFTPNDWKIIFDGESVSLHPSIGNWNFACQSHYWINNNHVRIAQQWRSGTDPVQQHLDSSGAILAANCVSKGGTPEKVKMPASPGLWLRIRRWLWKM